MKGTIKTLFNKRTTKQKTLGKIVVGVEIENRLELQELTQECCEAIEHLNNCIDKLNKFELKAKVSTGALEALEKAYNAFVKSNTENQKRSEADLVEAGRRLEFLSSSKHQHQ